MEISNAYPSPFGPGGYPPPASSGDGALARQGRREVVEPVLEGEWINERETRERQQARRDHYDYVERVRAQAPSPGVAEALAAYLTTATLDGFGFDDNLHRLDLYV